MNYCHSISPLSNPTSLPCHYLFWIMSSCLETLNAHISLFPLSLINIKYLSINLRYFYSDINSSFNHSPQAALKWLWCVKYSSLPCHMWAEAVHSAWKLILPFSIQKLLTLRSPVWKQSSTLPVSQVKWFIHSLPVLQCSVYSSYC